MLFLSCLSGSGSQNASVDSFIIYAACTVSCLWWEGQLHGMVEGSLEFEATQA
jgi:hypothetical protein